MKKLYTMEQVLEAATFVGEKGGYKTIEPYITIPDEGQPWKPLDYLRVANLQESDITHIAMDKNGDWHIWYGPPPLTDYGWDKTYEDEPGNPIIFPIAFDGDWTQSLHGLEGRVE
jgi:hypothetical protein